MKDKTFYSLIIVIPLLGAMFWFLFLKKAKEETEQFLAGPQNTIVAYKTDLNTGEKTPVYGTKSTGNSENLLGDIFASLLKNFNS